MRYTYLLGMLVERLARIASRHVEAGSKVYTDNFPSYNVLQGIGYSHDYVKHSEGVC